MLAELACKPHARLDHQRQRHPPDVPVRLDADLIGWPLPLVPRWLDQALPTLVNPRVPANSRPLTALEQAELILYAASDPSVTNKAKLGKFVTCWAPFDLLQSPDKLSHSSLADRNAHRTASSRQADDFLE